MYGSQHGAVHRERGDLAGRVSIRGLECADCHRPDGPDGYVAPITGASPRLEVCQVCAQARAAAQGTPYVAYFGYRDQDFGATK